MSRNSSSIITSVPTNRKPRSTIEIGPVDHLSSSQHGRLTPNFIKAVYPGDTFNMKDFAGFAYADKSAKLPLQDIIYDQYFFFVPFRVLDRNNWDKVLGARDNPLDHQVYSVPTFKFAVSYKTNYWPSSTYLGDINKLAPHLLPTYFGYNLPCIAEFDDSGVDKLDDNVFEASAYPLMAYWCIWNDFFRDENLDAAIDADTALNTLKTKELAYQLYTNSNDLGLTIADLESYHIIPERVNKLHDPLTSGMISPQKSPDGNPVPLFLGGMAPVIADGSVGGNGQLLQKKTGSSDLQLVSDNGAGTGYLADLKVDFSDATAVDINALRLAFSIQSLYEAKGRYGSRYIEYIRGIWSVQVPDAMLDRPEYLGGVRLSMNNMPVINTASDLGLFSGYSATLFNGSRFDKTFLEYGFVIGVHCERVSHVYTQGRDIDTWDRLVELDFYNPKFAELGFMGYPKDLIWAGDNSIFNYNEAWTYERAQLSRASGIFGPLGGSYYQDYREKWTYADYYEQAPTFNSAWLKEPTENVARTMTGSLIVGASNAVYGFQYMFDFKFHYTITRIIPVYSVPADLGGRW